MKNKRISEDEGLSNPDTPFRVLIYSRVSTSEQNVDQQAQYCKEWARRQGFEIVWTIKDKESGRKPLTERLRFLKIIN